MNIFLFIILIIISMLSIYLTYVFYDKKGLHYLLIIMIISSLLLSFKLVNLLGFNFNISIITNISIFSIIYILMEKNKKKEYKKITEISLLSIIISIIIFTIMTLYIPSINDSISINMKDMIINNYKIVIIHIISLLGNIFAIIYLYNKIKKITYNNIFIISTLFSITLGFISSIAFNFVGYSNILNTKEMIELILTNYLIVIILTMFYSIMLKHIFGIKKVNNE